MEPQGGKGRRRFRFEGAWLEQKECGGIVMDTWRTSQGSGGGSNIHNKLGRCRVKIQQWSKVNGVNYKKRIDELQGKLSEVQNQPRQIFNRMEEIRVKRLLEEAWKKEEEY